MKLEGVEDLGRSEVIKALPVFDMRNVTLSVAV